INLSASPTFLLVDSSLTSRLTSLFDSGIEDILALDDNLDLLVAKLHKIGARIREEEPPHDRKGSRGSRGRLSDTSLIDLLQELGPSRKTTRITLCQTEDTEHPLIIYLDRGHLSHASYGAITGAEVVYAAIGWTDGHWTVEQVAPEDLPEPNSELPNESILVEAYRRLEKRVRAGELS
ncbi:MAG: DUF4388 domain-containing protein, partial [Candidatus Zixiibacteriota bacterium]